MDDELAAVHLGDLTLAIVEETADDGDFVVLADGEGHALDAKVLAEVLGQTSGHDLPANTRGRREVRLAVAPPRGGNTRVELTPQKVQTQQKGTPNSKRKQRKVSEQVGSPNIAHETRACRASDAHLHFCWFRKSGLLARLKKTGRGATEAHATKTETKKTTTNNDDLVSAVGISERLQAPR